MFGHTNLIFVLPPIIKAFFIFKTQFQKIHLLQLCCDKCSPYFFLSLYIGMVIFIFITWEIYIINRISKKFHQYESTQIQRRVEFTDSIDRLSQRHEHLPGDMGRAYYKFLSQYFFLIFLSLPFADTEGLNNELLKCDCL